MACGPDDYVEDIVCEVSAIKNDELKLVKLKYGEVLLVKQNNVIRAVGPTCTHYGAPLVNSALGSGRIRCPLHGSCFNLCNGDLEDFPGLDSLPCYQVTVIDKNVKVRAKASDLCTNKKRKQMGEKCPLSKESIVLIGGGPASAVCAETLRQEKFPGEITMICKENILPYDRVRCSKELDFDITDAQFRTDDFYKTHEITVLKGVAATSVDTAKKEVTLDNNTVLQYTKLFVAVGFDPVRPDIPGMSLENVFVINHYEHANAINCTISKTTRVVIKGCGFVGMETAEFCCGKVRSITIMMETDQTILKDVFGKQIADAIVKRMQDNGVTFIPSVTVKKFNGSGNKVESVETSDGTKYPADLVVVDVGWVANTNFLKNSGLKVDDDGTIEANSYLESNIPGVWVGGDIANAPVWCDNNKKGCVGHIGVAMHHGRIAGMNMAGRKTELKVVIYYWTVLGGVSLRFCGHGQFDDIIYTGNVDEMKFIAYYLSKDDVIAMCSANMDPYVAKFAEIITQGKKLKSKDVSCRDDPLGWAK